MSDLEKHKTPQFEENHKTHSSYLLGLDSTIQFNALHESLCVCNPMLSLYRCRCLFKRHITPLQWFALCMLCMAIVVTKLSGDDGGIFIEPMAFLIAGVVSVLSVTAAVFMEVEFTVC